MESSTPLKDSVNDKEETVNMQTEDDSALVKIPDSGIQEPVEQTLAGYGDDSMVKENGLGDSTCISIGVEGILDTTEESFAAQESSDLTPAKEAKKSETTDVLCLQLDDGDNLDGYLEKERARKKELLKIKEIAEEKDEKGEIDDLKKPLPKKVKPAKKVKAAPKKKVAKPAPKVKSKVVEKVEVPEDKPSEEPKESDDNNTKEDEQPQETSDQNTSSLDESKDQPEVTVKSVVVKCEKPEKEQPKAESRFLWVSNINRNTKANDLKMLFTPHGKVQTARIVTDGRSYYGYLVLEKREEVDACIKQLEGTSFEGNRIHLSEKGPERKSNSAERKDVSKEASRDRSRKSSRHSSKSNDPLTLKVREKRDDDAKKFEKVLRRRSEERREALRRQKEAERIREERRKERIKYEERKAQELKIEREKRKLEHERHLIEKEKMNLLRLQKRLADTERLLIQRQKQELERDIKNLEYKKRKTTTTDTYDRKPKVSRMEETRPKEYWKDHKASPKSYDDSYKKDAVMVPPPPVLTDSYHPKVEKERSWDGKREDAPRYYDRGDYQDRYRKDRYKEKEKAYPWPNYSGAESWRPEPPRNIPRHTVPFPANSYGEPPATPGYYQGTTFRKTNEYYYRGPERKY